MLYIILTNNQILQVKTDTPFETITNMFERGFIHKDGSTYYLTSVREYVIGK